MSQSWSYSHVRKGRGGPDEALFLPAGLTRQRMDTLIGRVEWSANHRFWARKESAP